MILGHENLLERIENGMLEGHDLSLLGGAGYDLRLGAIYLMESAGKLGANDRVLPKIKPVDAESYTLSPGEYILVETLERVNMPKDLAARVLNRSSLFRCGCDLSNALVDPGYTGTLTFGLKNRSDQPFEVEKGAAIAQIVFEQVSGPTRGYDGRYQGGKVV